MKKLYSLCFILFVFTICATAQSSVDIDFSYRTGTGVPEAFGTCNYYADKLIHAGLRNQGFSSVRVDASIGDPLSIKICPTMEYWKANTNNIQDESTWKWNNNLQNLVQAKKDSMSVILLMGFLPDFLSYSYTDSTKGTFGIPKDWTIWQDIVKKVYTKWKDVVTYYEIWNEPNAFFTIKGSPYENMTNGRTIAFRDLYYYTAMAIRSVDSKAIIGGPALAWGGPYDSKNKDIFQALITDPQIKSANLFNFLSFHEYFNAGSTVITKNLANYRLELNKNGYVGLPVFIDEWNVGDMRNETFYNARGHAWYGKNLIAAIREGVGAYYYSTGNLNNSGYGNYYQTGNSESPTHTISMAHFTNSWKIPGSILGLRKGKYDVYKTTYTGNTTYPSVTVATAAVNSAGEKVWLLANDNELEKDVVITLRNVTVQLGDSILSWVSAGGVDVDLCSKLNFTIDGTTVTCSSIKIPAYSLVGFKIKKQTISAVKSVRNDNLKIYSTTNGIKLSQSANIEVFNFSGTKVISRENSDEVDLTPGLYIVKAITSEGLVYTAKVIVK